ncbi:MAG: hypothetical protein ACQEP7_05470 [bacterium]
MIDYTTVKIYILEHWMEALLIGILLVIAGGVHYYNRQQFSIRRQFLERVSSVPREEGAAPEVSAAPPGRIYERMLVADPEVGTYLRNKLPVAHRWGEPVNVLGLKIPSISLQPGTAHVGPDE